MNECIIETINLTRSYGSKKVVNNVNMHIRKGDIYGFVGKNGAGKTTIIRLITGLITPTSGNYKIYGISNEDKNIVESMKKVSAVVETPSIYLNMNARDNLYAQSLLKGNVSKKEIESILKIVGLDNVENSKLAKNYSLGMKQRLGIGIALIGRPEILILDEPTNGLDPEGIKEIRELLVELNKKLGVTILISSHILEELSKFATCYGFIVDGKLIEEISAKELEEKCKKRINVIMDSTAGIEKVLTDLSIKEYKILDGENVEIYQDVVVSDFVNAMNTIKRKVIKMNEISENIENYFINLIKGA